MPANDFAELRAALDAYSNDALGADDDLEDAIIGASGLILPDSLDATAALLIRLLNKNNALLAAHDAKHEALAWLSEAVEAVEAHPAPLGDEDVCQNYEDARVHARKTLDGEG